MADDTKNKNLFTKSDGSPVVFFMRPCAERQAIKPLINQHGGKVTSNSVPDCIKLAEKGSTVTEDGYVSTRYLKQCVMQNEMIDIDMFRIKPGTTAPGDSSDEDCESDYSLSPADNIQQRQAAQAKGRNKYTKEDDIDIIRHLITENLYNDAQGMKIWKQMEYLKVTNHTAQSMNTRYRKNILPNIQEYAHDIPRSWISRLTGVIPDANNSYDIEDMFKRKSPRHQAQYDASSTKTSNDQASSKPTKRLYQQLEFVDMEKNKNTGDKISSYFTNTANDDSRARDRLRLGGRKMNEAVSKSPAKSTMTSGKSSSRNKVSTNTSQKTCDINVRNKSTRVRVDSDSDCNVVSSSVEVVENVHVQDVVNDETNSQNSEDFLIALNRNGDNHDENMATQNSGSINLRRRALRPPHKYPSSQETKRNDGELSDDNKKRKRQSNVDDGKTDNRTDSQKKPKRTDGNDVIPGVSQNTKDSHMNSQTDPETDSNIIQDTPDSVLILDDTLNTKRGSLRSYKANNNRNISSKQKNDKKVPDSVQKKANSKAGQHNETTNFEVRENSKDSIEVNVHTQHERGVDTDQTGDETQESVRLEDETSDSENDADDSPKSSPILTKGPQTSTPKVTNNNKNNKERDKLTDLDQDKSEDCSDMDQTDVEDCRDICQVRLPSHCFLYPPSKVYYMGINLSFDNCTLSQTSSPKGSEIGEDKFTELVVNQSSDKSTLFQTSTSKVSKTKGDNLTELIHSQSSDNSTLSQASTQTVRNTDEDKLTELDNTIVEDCRDICKGIAGRYDLSYETVRRLLYGCNGNVRRALDYINFGPHSFYPVPWSDKDDALLDDHRNVPSLIVKYGATEVKERLLFLDGLL